jgi:glycosyltransferase involved in cell wall biosynthesis
MKILFPYLGRWRSANRSRYHQLIKHLCLLGHQVYVLEAPPTAINDISFSEPHVRPVPALTGLSVSELHAPCALRTFLRAPTPEFKLLKKGLLSLSSLDAVLRFVDEARIDVLLTYNLPQILLLRRVGCHKHFDFADNLVAMMEHEAGWLGRAGAVAAARQVQKWILHQANTVTVASSTLAEQAKRTAFLLPNGADLAVLDQADGSSWRSRGLGPCVGFVGAFEYWVDFHLLLALARELPRVNFLLVGHGRLWGELNLASKRQGLTNVHFTGAVAHELAMDYVAAMDVCLVPFNMSEVSHGSCPLKLFEYAGLRKPIVSTRVREVMRIGQGWVTFADDVAGFAGAIEHFLSNALVADEVGAAGRSAVEQIYNWPQLACQFLDFLGPGRNLDFMNRDRTKSSAVSSSATGPKNTPSPVSIAP